jgi:glycosyltransferase involved in cell wall biosynthesis
LIEGPADAIKQRSAAEYRVVITINHPPSHAVRSTWLDKARSRKSCVGKGTGMEDLGTLDRDNGKNVPSLIAPKLSIIIPTLNERANVGPLAALLRSTLQGIAWEAIFVDEHSRDGNSDHVRTLARSNPRIRCLQRVGRRGLTTACIEGVLASASPYVAVMDADLQHDERLLPNMYKALEGGNIDLVVGSRYISGGGTDNWQLGRARLSRFGTRLARLVCKADVADPLSGFFMCRREVFEQALRRMSGQARFLLRSVQRQHGRSKLDTMIAWEFGMLLADKLIGHIVPVRFALFRGDRRVWAGGPSCHVVDELEFIRIGLRRGAKRGHCGGNDLELLLNNQIYISRPEAERSASAARACPIFSDRRSRGCSQSLGGVLRVYVEPCLVAGRGGGSRRRFGLELRDVLSLHLASPIANACILTKMFADRVSQ